MLSPKALVHAAQLLVLGELVLAYRRGQINKVRLTTFSALLVTFVHGVAPRFPVWARLLGIGKHVVHRKVEGEVAPGFEAVREAFQKNVDEGLERGAQFVVYYKGKKVVDLAGGTQPEYNAETQQIIFSNSKTLSAITLAKAVAAGRIKYEAKVSEYWPEFAQNGKDDITVADVMRHDAGLAYFTKKARLPISYALRENLDKCADFLAKQAPSWTESGDEPKSRAYHAVTRDLITGELVRRVDPEGRTMGMILRAEIAEPLDATLTLGPGTQEEKELLSDLQFESIPQTVIGYFIRKFLGIALPTEGLFLSVFGDPKSTVARTFNCLLLDGIRDKDTYFNEEIMHDAEMGSSNVRSNARSMAKVADAMSRRALLPEHVHEAAMANPVEKYDSGVMGETNFTQGGFCKFGGSTWDASSEGFAGWGGLGGSQLMWNDDEEIGVAYVMNGNLATSALGLLDPRFLRLQRTLMACIKAQSQ